MSLEKTTQDLTLHSMRIVFTPRSLFFLFVLLFSGLIVEDVTTAATSPLLQSDRLIARSIASTDADGRNTRIATYTFCKNKTETDSEHKESLSKTA